MRGDLLRAWGILSSAAAALGLAACGGGAARQDVAEPSATFPVSVSASFPPSQRLSEHSAMVVKVRNTGNATIPDVTVSVTDPKRGTSVQPFGAYDPQVDVAYHSRPVWIIDEPPGPCDYSCQNGGPGSAATAYSGTWALGALKPGATATFRWALTAVQPGVHSVRYSVAAGLNGKAVAHDASGAIPGGVLTVNITGRPRQAYVNDQGQLVEPGGATTPPVPAKGGASGTAQ